MTLALNSCSVDQDTCIGCQTWKENNYKIIYMIRFVNSFIMYWLSLVLRQSLHPTPCDPHRPNIVVADVAFWALTKLVFQHLKKGKKKGRKVMFGTTEKTHYRNSRTSQIKLFSCFNHAYTISDQNSMAKMIHFLRPIPKYVGTTLLRACNECCIHSLFVRLLFSSFFVVKFTSNLCVVTWAADCSFHF